MQVKVVIRADVSGATYDKVAVISGVRNCTVLKKLSFQFYNLET